MGNRAVITSKEYLTNPDTIGVYLHWNGGRDSVQAFLLYCKLKGYRPPETDCYGWARLCQVVGNYFGGELSLGIDACSRLDCDNWDNGVYIVKGWEIVGRKFAPTQEQDQYDLLEMLRDINAAQPPTEQLPDEVLQEEVQTMQFTIKKSKIPAWGYEITAKGFHNIAPSVEAAIAYLSDRYGSSVKYRVIEEDHNTRKDV